MTQVILIKGTFNEQARLEKKLREELNSDVIVKDTIKEALMLFRILPDSYALFLPEEDRTKSDALKELRDLSRDLEIRSLIFLSSAKNKKGEAVVVDNLDFLQKKMKRLSFESSVDELVREIKLSFAQDLRARSQDLYFPVSLRLMHNLIVNEGISIFPFSLYVGIKSKEKETHFILRFRKNETIEQIDFLRFKNQNIVNLFITIDDEVEFKEFLIQYKKSLDLDEKRGSIEGQIQSVEASTILLRQKIMSIGFTDEVIELVDSYFKESLSVLRNQGAFQKLLKAFLEEKTSFQYGHSLLLSLVLNKVSLKLGWDSAQFREKVVFISLMHDLLLFEDELCKIKNYEDLIRNDELTDEKLNLLNNHAIMISQMVEKLPKIPKGAEDILREHHGMKNGVGFHEGPNYHIHNLSMVFIVCEEFVHEILALKNPTKGQLQAIIFELRATYPRGYYAMALDALEDIFCKV